MKTRRIHTSVIGTTLVATLILSLLTTQAFAVETNAGEAPADSSLTLAGGEDGTVFKSLTIEAENRVQITFERPELVIALDPSQAPGLTWGTAMDVLNRTVPNLTAPLLGTSSHLRSPYRIHPWLAAYKTGSVAIFASEMDGVDRWSLLVVDSRGQEVVQFTGKKNPPKTIAWDGKRQDGTMALPGLTYSYVMEAYDKAGNKRRFVGEGFQLEAYRQAHADGPEFLITGKQWRDAANAASPGASAYLLEAASRLNLKKGADTPVTVTATAGSYAEAQALGEAVAAELRPLLPGNNVRVAVSAVVQPGTPVGGILQIRVGEYPE
jgi:hypothetical protein